MAYNWFNAVYVLNQSCTILKFRFLNILEILKFIVFVRMSSPIDTDQILELR